MTRQTSAACTSGHVCMQFNTRGIILDFLFYPYFLSKSAADSTLLSKWPHFIGLYQISIIILLKSVENVSENLVIYYTICTSFEPVADINCAANLSTTPNLPQTGCNFTTLQCRVLDEGVANHAKASHPLWMHSCALCRESTIINAGKYYIYTPV